MTLRWLAAVAAALMLLGCASAPDLSRPSIAETQSVVFAGKTFVLKYEGLGKVPVREYYLPDESIAEWSELLDFRIAPLSPGGDTPRDYATRTALSHQQKYPELPVELYADDKTDAVYLLLYFPTSTRKDGHFFEFNLFKFYKDSGTAQLINFHFAKNILADTPAARQELAATMQRLRAEVIPAMGAFPLYRQ